MSTAKRARAHDARAQRPTSRDRRSSSPSSNRGGRSRSLPVLAPARVTVPCLSCALCCSYVAIDIDGPETLRAATDILFYLYHDRVSVYEEDGDWMVQFETRCQNLQSDNRCAIYETRPPICREYAPRECEVNAGHAGRLFCAPEEFLAYLAEHQPRTHAAVRKRYAPAADGARQRKQRGAFPARYSALRARAGH